jgi:hypothetical protein
MAHSQCLTISLYSVLTHILQASIEHAVDQAENSLAEQVRPSCSDSVSHTRTHACPSNLVKLLLLALALLPQSC